MNLKYIAKRTSELDKSERCGICCLFAQVFGKELSLERFERKYSSPAAGCSYHGLAFSDNGEIVGHSATIPFAYNYFGEEKIFGLVVDSMIDPSFRKNIFTLKKMFDQSTELMKSDHVSFVFAVPNENAYQYWLKIGGWKDIGNLNYFVLPIRIGAVLSKLRVLDILSCIFARLINFPPFRNDGILKEKFPIAKAMNKSFLKYRYDIGYKLIEYEKDSFAFYKVYDENGVRTAFIIDVFHLTKQNVEKTTKAIFCKNKSNIDIIVYIGNFGFNPRNLFLVSPRFAPRILRLCGKKIDDALDDRIYEIDNWRYNLADLDVR
jgi:hypothetical protein